MVHVLAAIFFDEFAEGWRFHVFFPTFDLISSFTETEETRELAVDALRVTIQHLMVDNSQVQVHFVVYRSYVDYEIDLWEQYMVE